MHIVFHAHNAAVPQSLIDRAEVAIEKLAARLPRAVEAAVRFVEDGPHRRVEIVLHAPRQARLVGLGEARRYDLALNDAVGRLETHVAHAREAKARRIRAARGAAERAGGARAAVLPPAAGEQMQERPA